MDNSLIVAPSLLTQIDDDAEKYIQPDWSPEQVNAARIHYKFVNIARLVTHAGRMLRELATEMYLSGGYASLVVQIDGSDLRFADFREWLSYATSTAGLSDSTESYINNYICFLVDPVSKNLITRPNGELVQVEDIAELREGHTNILSSAARRLLQDPEKGTASLGELIEIAEDPTISQGEMEEEARKRGLRERRIPQAEAKVIQLGDKTIFIVKAMTEPQEMSITSALDPRVTWSSITLEDGVEFLNTQRITEVEMPTDEDMAALAQETAMNDDIDIEEYLKSV
jgi:hypothetical protein